MTKLAPVLALAAGAILLLPCHVALAISTESATGDSGGNAQIADPDAQIDEIANPGSGTAGSATIELPRIDMPGDSNDYSPPSDSEDDPALDAPASGSSN